jgi:hypothetical protein
MRSTCIGGPPGTNHMLAVRTPDLREADNVSRQSIEFV